jgi:hypothetical protein
LTIQKKTVILNNNDIMLNSEGKELEEK